MLSELSEISFRMVPDRSCRVASGSNAKEEMARQASEYYSNKDLWREELGRYKQILNEVIASMNSIIENGNTRPRLLHLS